MASGDMNSPDYVMFANSSTQLLTAADLSSLTPWELSVARNEIYARHGFVFKTNAQIKAYFENKSWYQENPSFQGTDSELNQTEITNIKLIRTYEANANG